MPLCYRCCFVHRDFCDMKAVFQVYNTLMKLGLREIMKCHLYH